MEELLTPETVNLAGVYCFELLLPSEAELLESLGFVYEASLHVYTHPEHFRPE